MFYNEYTLNNEKGFTFTENKCYDRHQADYDYNGCTDSDGDSADYYRPIRVVRVG